MFAKLVAELKVIVAEIKSPFSYIHDKAVEALAEAHKEVEELKARIYAIELHVGLAPTPLDAAEPVVAPTEVVSYPDVKPEEPAGDAAEPVVAPTEVASYPDVKPEEPAGDAATKP
jgi:hypothetical protein